MNNIIVLSPKVSCESAKKLASVLGADYDNPYKSDKYDYTNYALCVKYGVTAKIKAKKVINKTSAILKSIDKIAFLKALSGDGIGVQMTLDYEVAKSWIKEGPVVCRRTNTGHDSEGVVICYTLKELEGEPETMFWTKYQAHTHEFRVNIWRNTVLSMYDKKTTGENEFVFHLFQGLEKHPQLLHLVDILREKIGLDFYGMDVLRDKKGQLHVLELNSAPVLFPFTIRKLAEQINKEL